MQQDVQAVLSGNKDAFRAIVRAHGPSVRALLASHISDSHTVDDLAQETFIAAYESLGSFRLDGDIGVWLRGIARNLLLNHLRRSHQRGKILERLRSEIAEEALTTVSEIHDAAGDDAITRLRECFQKLPERLREILSARHSAGERVTAIAERLNTSETAVSSLLFRGRKTLRDCMDGGR